MNFIKSAAVIGTLIGTLAQAAPAEAISLKFLINVLTDEVAEKGKILPEYSPADVWYVQSDSYGNIYVDGVFYGHESDLRACEFRDSNYPMLCDTNGYAK